jgi:hypothetical protein
MNEERQIRASDVLAWVGALAGVLILVAIIGFGLVAAIAAFSRYQTVADAQNQVQVNDIKIAQTNQLVQVQEQQAKIRVADAQGIAQSQSIINGSLTPAYLQYLAIQAQIDMAQKSDHSATIYIPVGNNGIPVVTTQPVTGPA